MSEEHSGILEEDSGRDQGPEGVNIPEIIPLLPIRDIVVFPYMIVPLIVGREKSIRALDEALKSDRLIFLTAQQTGDVEDPGFEDLHELGTVSVIVRMLKTPDGKAKILVQGLQRGQVKEFVQADPFFSARLELIDERSS
jgi:ATP-dependent Lon protease